MTITLNGSVVETTASTVALLLGDLPGGRAVAINGEVVPRSAHHIYSVRDGDTIEVVEAVAGG